ncbi:hypothetical protein Tco_0429909, partial [Tanacetum coccineum]
LLMDFELAGCISYDFLLFTLIELYTFLSQLRHRLGNLGETFNKSSVVTGSTCRQPKVALRELGVQFFLLEQLQN